MGMIINPFSHGSAANGPHRYWRLLISEAQVGSPTYVGVTELSLHETVGGANIAGTYDLLVSSGQVNTDNSSDRAFDGNLTTSGWLDNGASLPRYIGVRFATAKSIAQFKVTASHNFPNGTPKAFTLQHSDDGSAWSDAASLTNETGWGAVETRTYNV